MGLDKQNFIIQEIEEYMDFDMKINNNIFSSIWHMFFVRGLLALIISLFLRFSTFQIELLIFFLGSYIFIDGCISVWMGGLSRQSNFVVFGCIAILIGMYAFYPDKIDNFFFLSLMCAWAWLHGIFDIAIVATNFCKKRPIKYVFVSSGLVCILIGVIAGCLHPSQVSDGRWFFSIFYLVLSVICFIVGIDSYKSFKHFDLKNVIKKDAQ